MATQPFVTGPVTLWAGVGSGGSPVEIGFSERGFRGEIRPSWGPYFNDIGGPGIPTDIQANGEEMFVFGDLTRWNEAAYAAVASRPNSQGVRGHGNAGDLGALMLYEGYAYPIYLVFPYSFLKAAYSTQPGGYRLFQTFLEGPDVLEPLGTTASKRRLIFHALRVLTFGPYGSVIQDLYDQNVSAVSGLTVT